nr:MAG TPA: hypothetical protein [Caudoviricetes sp.]
MTTVNQLRKALCDYKSECERNESCTRCVYWNVCKGIFFPDGFEPDKMEIYKELWH